MFSEEKTICLRSKPNLILHDIFLTIVDLVKKEELYKNPKSEKIISGLSVSEDERYCGYVIHNNFYRQIRVLDLETFKYIEFRRFIQDESESEAAGLDEPGEGEAELDKEALDESKLIDSCLVGSFKKLRVFFYEQKAIVEFLDDIENRYCLIFFDLDHPEEKPKFETIMWPFQCAPNMPFGFYTDGFLTSTFVSKTDSIPKNDDELVKVSFNKAFLLPTGRHYVTTEQSYTTIYPAESFFNVIRNDSKEQFNRIEHETHDFLFNIYDFHTIFSPDCRLLLSIKIDRLGHNHLVYVYNAENLQLLGTFLVVIPRGEYRNHSMHVTSNFILLIYSEKGEERNITKYNLRKYCPILKLWDLIPQGLQPRPVPGNSSEGLQQEINSIWWNFCRGHLLYDPRLFLLIRDMTCLEIKN